MEKFRQVPPLRYLSLAGPTAVGKSDTAVEVAKQLQLQGRKASRGSSAVAPCPQNMPVRCDSSVLTPYRFTKAIPLRFFVGNALESEMLWKCSGNVYRNITLLLFSTVPVQGWTLVPTSLRKRNRTDAECKPTVKLP